MSEEHPHNEESSFPADVIEYRKEKQKQDTDRLEIDSKEGINSGDNDQTGENADIQEDKATGEEIMTADQPTDGGNKQDNTGESSHQAEEGQCSRSNKEILSDDDAMETWGSQHDAEEPAITTSDEFAGVDKKSTAGNTDQNETEDRFTTNTNNGGDNEIDCHSSLDQTSNDEVIPVEEDNGKTDVGIEHENPSDEENINADFSGVSIDGATENNGEDEENTASNEGLFGVSDQENQTSTNDQSDTPVGGIDIPGANSKKNDSANEAEAASNETPPQQDIDEGTFTESSTKAIEPKLEPKPHVRTPKELLIDPVLFGLNGAKTLGLGLIALTTVLIHWFSIAMELVATGLFMLYLVGVAMILIFPTYALGIEPGTSAAIWDLTITIIPFTVVVFTVSKYIDKWLNDGQRYQTEKPIKRF